MTSHIQCIQSSKYAISNPETKKAIKNIFYKQNDILTYISSSFDNRIEIKYDTSSDGDPNGAEVCDGKKY